MNLLKKRPWLLIVFGFIFLIIVWTGFIILALKNQPERVPLQPSTTQATP